MFKFAVCDDRNEICSQVENYVLNVCSRLGVECEFEVYYSGESLCRSIENGEIYDLVFLDIELSAINGVQVGTKIREEYNNVVLQIVYISNEKKYAMELFKIHPLDFLVKPLGESKIQGVINKFLKIANYWSDVFTYEIGRDSFKVSIKDIKYFESSNRKIIMHLKDRKEEFYGSLESIFRERIKKYENFMYIHKSFIVNYDYVYLFEYDRLFLHDQTELPISQSKRKEIRTLKKFLDKRRT